MNKSFVALSLVAGLFSAQTAHADDNHNNPTGVYLGANIGYDNYDDDDINDFGDGGSIGFQLGYRWNEHVRTELELSGSGAELNNGTDDILGYGRLTLGAYYDFVPTSQTFVPYVGGGIGAATVYLDSDVTGDEEDGGLFSWHGEAGLTMNLNEHFALVPSYRYTWVEDDTSLLEDDLSSHSFRIGARVSF